MRRAVLELRATAATLWCGCRLSSSSSEGTKPRDDASLSAATSPAVEKGEYNIPTADILRAVKQRDFNAFQSHAVDIVQHKWNEELNIPAVCVLFFLLTWYWVSSTRRRAVRSCRATEAKVKEEAEQTLELVNTLVRKWRQDVQRADQKLHLILDKNSELTKDIDCMTAALRQCYVGMLPNKATQAFLLLLLTLLLLFLSITMYLSQVFILSPRGDKIIFKDYRQDAPNNTDEIFFRKYKFWDGAQHQAPEGQCPPFFIEKGVNFCYVKRRELLFVCTSVVNVSPSLTVEILLRIVRVIKDYLGFLSEENIRKNFTLVYELLDEMLDVGVPQELNTEHLRPYIFNDVISVSKPNGIKEDSFFGRLKRGELMERTRRGDASLSSVVQASGERKNEIFVDIVERLNVVFSNTGQVVVSDVDGSIIMKSFLVGSPVLYLSFNEDLVVRRGDANKARYASVVLDSVSFHEDADHSSFETERQLSIRPPEGEFTLMNYRLSTDGTQPFRLVQSIELLSSQRAVMMLRIRADIPVSTHGIAVSVRVPMPLSCTAATVEMDVGAVGQSYDYKDEEKCVVWNIDKFFGGTEQVCNIRFSTATNITAATRRNIGPIAMRFEIPQYSVTGLGIKMLRLEERSSSFNPTRWIRNVTLASSYVFRTH